MTLPNFLSADFTSSVGKAEFEQELKAIEAESMGWQPLEAGAYFHRGAPVGSEQESVVEIVGILSDTALADANVLLLVWS